MDLHSTKRRKKGDDDPNTIPLEKHIEQKRIQLVTERQEVPKLRKQSDDVRSQVLGMTRRWQYRESRDMLLHADELDKEADARESMSREHEYEKMVVRYLQLYHKRVEIGVDPNMCKKKETIDAYVRQADLTTQRQSALIYEYLADTGESPPRVAVCARDECPHCNEKLLLVQTKSILTCNKCGYSVTYLDASSQSTSYDDTVEFSIFAYKRVNHFLSWVAHVQGKESCEVSDDVLQQVMGELYKQRATIDQINPKMIRDILKRLKLRKCYDNVAQICFKVTGIKPQRVSSDTEEVLKRMFLMMQPAFEANAPKTRKNFLSYSYVLYRFFQILGLYHMLPNLNLLKGKEKLAVQDEVFSKICKDLGWNFDPRIH
jgi:ribosomal protein S27AE